MGITGLLPFLEQATKPCHVSEFRGATVVIDTYCWLHKGATACAVQLARGEDTQIYVDYCLKYVKMLQSFNIRPILVFDGKNLPAKADTEAKRRESRNRAKQRAAELLSIGKPEEARNYLRQCINITPDMASALIKECHKINVDCIVAPYECDAQLAYFNLKGIAEVVITEDSDLVLFGCSKIIYKLDLRGTGYLVEADKIPAAMKLRPDKYTFDKFRHMCILSGCDYIDSLRGIGLKKAKKFISLTEETNPEIFLDKLPRYLNMQCLQITPEYKENFMIAEATFRHQVVFDPFQKKLVPLTDPAVTGTNPEHCKNAGAIFDHELAYQIAIGNLHPTTFKKLDNWSPSKTGSSSNSIWSECYKKSISRKSQKAQFRQFFKTDAKVKAIVENIDDEQIKIEEDKKIAKELEFYSQKNLQPQRPSTSETNVDTQKSPKKKSLSPILKTNPFVVEKKFSKFHRTSTSSEIVVRSRYFANEENIEVEEETALVEYNEKSDVENMPNNGITTIEENTTKENTHLQSDSNKDDSGDTLIIDDGSEEEAIKVITEKLEINFTQLSKEEVKVSDKSSSSKRKKVGPCRSVGLKRTKSDGQKTIQAFFKKLNEK